MRRWAEVGMGMLAAMVLLARLFIGGGYLFVRHEMHGTDSFCDSIGESETAREIIDRATAAGLFFTRWQGTDDMWILNKPMEASPMFRVACAVTFKGGKVSGKGLVDGD